MTIWNAGDKAYCVDGGKGKALQNLSPNGLPQKGTIYLVLSITNPIGNKGVVGLSIAGLPVIDEFSGVEVGWYSTRFRKIVSRSEQIAKVKEARKYLDKFWPSLPINCRCQIKINKPHLGKNDTK